MLESSTEKLVARENALKKTQNKLWRTEGDLTAVKVCSTVHTM